MTERQRMTPSKTITKATDAKLHELIVRDELSGYTSPTSGKITYNKGIGKRSFAQFTDIIESIVPIHIVTDPYRNHSLPSIARVLIRKNVNVYNTYLYMNATQDEYMDYEDDEDQENMRELLDVVDKKRVVIGITIQKSEAMRSAHASAFICWLDDSNKIKSKQNPKPKYKFAFYDPLSYKRTNSEYDFIERAFTRSRFKSIGNINFVNLNKYCAKNGNDHHCTQYIINAEYCYIYSLYFLHAWIKAGRNLELSSFKDVIMDTYIVDPTKLTRSNNQYSMKYRVVMMMFVCSTLLRYLTKIVLKQKRAQLYIVDAKNSIHRINTFLEEFRM